MAPRSKKLGSSQQWHIVENGTNSHDIDRNWGIIYSEI
jgi:hypothetical protein